MLKTAKRNTSTTVCLSSRGGGTYLGHLETDDLVESASWLSREVAKVDGEDAGLFIGQTGVMATLSGFPAWLEERRA
jgi:hypothetical protein